ncbi:hypothetical protein D041_0457A, partial [Vibrio parahaemolyticus EKP-008]
MFGKDRQDDS